MPRAAKDPTLPKAEPWKPPYYTVADVSAFQALNRGDATEDQQRRALKYVIETLCGTYDLAYRPASSRDTDFALGKVWVGQQLVKFLHINVSALREDPSSGRPPT